MKRERPDAYAIASRIRPDATRELLLTWLNGNTSSPISYCIADAEVIKEDGHVSRLKNGYFISVRSYPAGNCVRHGMTTGMIRNFLDNPEGMIKLNRRKTTEYRVKCNEVRLQKIVNEEGLTWVIEKLGLRQRKAANDD